jgi:hypothetical protein
VTYSRDTHPVQENPVSAGACDALASAPETELTVYNMQEVFITTVQPFSGCLGIQNPR